MSNDRDPDAGFLGSERNKAEVERALLEITARASANAEGDVGVGLSIVTGDTIRSIGATTPAAQQLDNGQAEDGHGPCVHALRSGQSVSVVDYASDNRWPGTSRRAAEAGVRSSLSLPLKTRNDVILGALNVYSNRVDAFSVTAGSSLSAFAAQATTSLFLLGELQEQRDDSAYVTTFARTVQRSLKAVLPEVPGLELVGGSVPAATRASVSGDWYDALVLPDGSVGLVIGDVMGHDIQAVTTMAQLRTMVRAGAWLGNSADEVLSMTDQLAHLAGITETATVFFGRLTMTATGGQLDYCNAGHLQPLVRAPDGKVTVLEGGRRMLLGALGTGAPTPVGHTSRAALPSGSILLLYTDGLVERRSTTFDVATDQLIAALADFDASGPLDQLCQQLLAGTHTHDDTTVFTIRVG